MTSTATTDPRGVLEMTAHVYATAKQMCETGPAEERAGARVHLRAAQSAYFSAWTDFVKTTGHATELSAFGSAGTLAASYTKQAAYALALGGEKEIPDHIRTIIRQHLETWVSAEKAIADLGYRTISQKDFQDSVEIPGVVSKTAPALVYNKIGVVREPGEDPVFHAAAALKAWDEGQPKPAA